MTGVDNSEASERLSSCECVGRMMIAPQRRDCRTPASVRRREAQGPNPQVWSRSRVYWGTDGREREKGVAVVHLVQRLVELAGAVSGAPSLRTRRLLGWGIQPPDLFAMVRCADGPGTKARVDAAATDAFPHPDEERVPVAVRNGMAASRVASHRAPRTDRAICPAAGAARQ